jgi:hypothetical protein
VEELREIILTHLAEMEAGIEPKRYALYVEQVRLCSTVEELLELAGLELQMETHAFMLGLAEDDADIEDDYGEFGSGDDGFGEEDDPEMVEMRALQDKIMGTVIEDDDYFNIDALLSSAPTISFQSSAPPEATADNNAPLDFSRAFEPATAEMPTSGFGANTG